MIRAAYKTFITLLLTMPLLAACSDKETPNVLPRLSEVEHYYYDITHTYANAERKTLIASDTVLIVTTERWKWDGDQLASIGHYKDNEWQYDITFEQADYGVRRTDSREPNAETRYIYNGGSLTNMAYYVDGENTWLCDIHLIDSGTMIATVKNFSNGTETERTEYLMHFGGGNLLDLSYSVNGSNTYKSYRYLSAANPYRLTDRSITPSNLSNNLAIEETYTYRDEYDTRKEEITDYNYTLDGNNPRTLDYQKESFVGKYHNIYKHHYEYRYTE